MLNIDGRSGLYIATTTDKRSSRWIERHCPDAIKARGGIAIEGSANCVAIVAAAKQAGLTVNVNGERVGDL